MKIVAKTSLHVPRSLGTPRWASFEIYDGFHLWLDDPENVQIMKQDIFSKFYYSLELGEVPSFTLRIVFGAMKSRY